MFDLIILYSEPHWWTFLHIWNSFFLKSRSSGSLEAEQTGDYREKNKTGLKLEVKMHKQPGEKMNQQQKSHNTILDPIRGPRRWSVQSKLFTEAGLCQTASLNNRTDRPALMEYTLISCGTYRERRQQLLLPTRPSSLWNNPCLTWSGFFWILFWKHLVSNVGCDCYCFSRTRR